jgi:hypothetical protein
MIPIHYQILKDKAEYCVKMGISGMVISPKDLYELILTIEEKNQKKSTTGKNNKRKKNGR